uniref:Actin-related protein 2/3 complex subunit 5 n=1 Tax=Pristionchus pacificus TaxID=54126 RepID=A0A2A6BUQ2_PRIPA|eukprot:PDM69546.1 arx-7 [Pristionchus pacificus]
MATNVESTTYRKLDVDALEEDKFDEGEDNCSLSGVDEKTIDMLLQGNRNGEALHTVLQNTPVGTKITPELKDRTTLIMSKVLKSFRVNEIETAVSGLSEKEADLLIKLVYRSFELEPEGPLLQWHSQVVSRFGKGPIVRVFTSRNAL